jgi:hypothetical protein
MSYGKSGASVLHRLLCVACATSCVVIALPYSATEKSTFEGDLKESLLQLERSQMELKETLEKIKNAFTQSQFEIVSSRIQTEPQIIISDATSPLQVKAARLVLEIKSLSGKISDLEYKTHQNNEKRYLPLKKNLTSFLNQNLGQDALLISLDDPANEALARYGLLIQQVHQQFQEYLARTDFLSRSEINWQAWLSQARNVLSNQRSRFETVRRRIADYRAALRRIQQSLPAEEIELEIALRAKALDVYADAVARMERRGGSVESSFPEICPLAAESGSDSVVNCASAAQGGQINHQQRADRGDSDRSSKSDEEGMHRGPGHACGTGCCPRDAPFTFRAGDAPPALHAALRVLSRRTAHYLRSRPAPANLEARARALAARPLYRHGDPVHPPEAAKENPRWAREARRPTFAGMPAVPLPARIVVRPALEYPAGLAAPGGGPPRNPAVLSSELAPWCGPMCRFTCICGLSRVNEQVVRVRTTAKPNAAQL